MLLKSNIWSYSLLTILCLATSLTEASEGLNTASSCPIGEDGTVDCNNVCGIGQNVLQNISEILDDKLGNLQLSVLSKITTIRDEFNNIRDDVATAIRSTRPTGSVGSGAAAGRLTCDALEKIPTLEGLIRNLLNISERTQANVAQTNRDLDVLKNNLTECGKCDADRSTAGSLYGNILEQVTSIANKLTDPDYGEQTILESIENIIAQRFTATENNLLNSINARLETLENNIDSEIRETVGKSVSDNAANITKQIGDKIESALIENINRRLGALENIPNLERQIQNLLSIAEQIRTSLAETSSNNRNISGSNENGSGRRVSTAPPPPPSVMVPPATVPPTTVPPVTVPAPACAAIEVPSSVRVNRNIWTNNQVPADDALDRYMTSTTGCTYRPLPHGRYFVLPSGVPYTGRYELRSAVRARDSAYVGVWWSSTVPGYGFTMGQDNNTNTVMYRWRPWKEIQRRATPQILDEDRYITYYIRIQNGVLMFGRGCDREPLFSQNVSIQLGDLVRTSFEPKSDYGAKYLHRCRRLSRVTGWS